MNHLLDDERMMQRIKEFGYAQAIADIDRGSGRTTGIAMSLLGAAISSPTKVQYRTDHAGGSRANADELALTVARIVRLLRLRNIHCSVHGNTVDSYSVAVVFSVTRPSNFTTIILD